MDGKTPTLTAEEKELLERIDFDPSTSTHDHKAVQAICDAAAKLTTSLLERKAFRASALPGLRWTLTISSAGGDRPAGTFSSEMTAAEILCGIRPS